MSACQPALRQATFLFDRPLVYLLCDTFGRDGLANHGLRMGGHPAVTAKDPFLKVGFDKPGTNQHDVGAGISELRSQCCEKSVQGMLAGTVARPPQQWQNAGQAF